MTLLGRPLLALVVLLALAAPALTVWLWPRVRGRRAVRVSQRAALVVLAQLLALVCAAVALNDYGTFYTSWAELFGRPASVSQATHYGAPTPEGAPAFRIEPQGAHSTVSDAANATIAGHATLGWSRPQDWAQRGAVVSLPVTGPSTGLAQDTLVYLPPQYFAMSDPQLPLVEAFSGYPGHPLGLVNRLKYPDLALQGVEAGRLRPMVIVMLRPTAAFPRDTECSDVPHGPQSLTYLADEVPRAISDALDFTISGVGAVGDSTGGYCALHLALTHPSEFSAAASMSGYYHALSDSTTGDIFGGDPAVRRGDDLDWRLSHLPMPRTAIFLATSQTEHGFEGHKAAALFLSHVRAPLQADEIVLSQGGHNFATWSVELPRALQFLSDHLATAAAASTPPTPPTPSPV